MASVSYLLLLLVSLVHHLVRCVPQGQSRYQKRLSLVIADNRISGSRSCLRIRPIPSVSCSRKRGSNHRRSILWWLLSCRGREHDNRIIRFAAPALTSLVKVAGLVWYSEIFINTAATALVSVGLGNGTRATRTSVLQNEGAFTFNPAATAQSGALTQLNFAPTANVGGVQLCVMQQTPHKYQR